MVNQRNSGEIKIFHPLRTQELRRAVGNKRSDDDWLGKRIVHSELSQLFGCFPDKPRLSLRFALGD
jgi:hypothetical protein